MKDAYEIILLPPSVSECVCMSLCASPSILFRLMRSYCYVPVYSRACVCVCVPICSCISLYFISVHEITLLSVCISVCASPLI
jgi:hypothetical protein